MSAKLTKFEKLQHIFLQVQKLSARPVQPDYAYIDCMIHALCGYHQHYTDIQHGEQVGIDAEFVENWMSKLDMNPTIEQIDAAYLKTLSEIATAQYENKGSFDYTDAMGNKFTGCAYDQIAHN